MLRVSIIGMLFQNVDASSTVPREELQEKYGSNFFLNSSPDVRASNISTASSTASQEELLEKYGSKGAPRQKRDQFQEGMPVMLMYPDGPTADGSPLCIHGNIRRAPRSKMGEYDIAIQDVKSAGLFGNAQLPVSSKAAFPLIDYIPMNRVWKSPDTSSSCIYSPKDETLKNTLGQIWKDGEIYYVKAHRMIQVDGKEVLHMYPLINVMIEDETFPGLLSLKGNTVHLLLPHSMLKNKKFDRVKAIMPGESSQSMKESFDISVEGGGIKCPDNTVKDITFIGLLNSDKKTGVIGKKQSGYMITITLEPHKYTPGCAIVLKAKQASENEVKN